MWSENLISGIRKSNAPKRINPAARHGSDSKTGLSNFDRRRRCALPSRATLINIQVHKIATTTYKRRTPPQAERVIFMPSSSARIREARRAATSIRNAAAIKVSQKERTFFVSECIHVPLISRMFCMCKITLHMCLQVEIHISGKVNYAAVSGGDFCFSDMAAKAEGRKSAPGRLEITK